MKSRLQDPLVRILLVIGVVAIATTVGLVGWFTQPARFARGYAPSQPIAFSHRLHAGDMSIDCLYCHSGARPEQNTRNAGVPSVETCMNCHRVTRTDRPDIQRLTKIHQNDEKLEWNRVHTLPDHVYFDHRPHVRAGIVCQTCHGPVQTMDVLTRRMSMRMSNCLGCHRAPKEALPAGSAIKRGPEECSACHR
ncbi:MAG: hypothetical protein A2506_10775 [Elusimicrobia bacterium RIFOXYD12_FULL_66_9]|nr:MAG: hypothetical protein A2506_10775 [Elusimicrobia bacterium RIFOXYD12_FULL_66_9]